MEIREYRTYNEQEILRLYSSVGWTAYTDTPDTLQQGFEHSLLTLAAYENGQLVGLIRTVGDGYTIVFVQDILVFPEHQRKGIGTALLQAVLDRFSHVRQMELATDDTPQTIAFYKSLGFSPMSEIGCCGFMRLLPCGTERNHKNLESDNSGLTKQRGLGMINPSVPMVNQGVRDSSQLMADDYARPEGQNILIE